MNLFDAIKKSVEVLEGAYSFLLISILDPEAMYVVKNTGTMVIGFPQSLAKGNKSTEGSSNSDAKLDSISDMSSEKQKEKDDEDIHKF
jgi:glucosamine 6-phosphate synthetase-like amidotransferase/phosphosugar isomerase protein